MTESISTLAPTALQHLQVEEAATAPAPNPMRLDALTSLRFFAAMAIVYTHLAGSFGIPDQQTFLFGQSVGFFFILSGFILTFVYPSLSAPGAKLRFLRARFSRLWPAHIVALGLYFLLPWTFVVNHGFSWPTLAANVLMVHAWIPYEPYYFSYNSPSWSIAAEFGFYLMFPLLIWRFDRYWWAKLLGAFLLVGALVTISNRMDLPQDPSDSSAGWLSNSGLLYVNPLTRSLEFVFGMCCCKAFLWLRRQGQPRVLVATLLEVAALALVVSAMFYTRPICRHASLIPWIGSGGARWLRFGGTPMVPFGVLITVFAMGRGVLSKALSDARLVLLGEISYSIYIFHWVLFTWAIYLLRFGDTAVIFARVPGWVIVSGYLVVLLAGSHLSWTLVETPIRAILSPRKRVNLTVPAKLRWNVVIGEAAAIAYVIAPVFLACATGARIYRLTYDEAIAAQEHSIPEAANVIFGGKLNLYGATLMSDDDGTHLKLAWGSNADQTLDGTVKIDLLDNAANVLDTTQYPQDAAGSAIVNDIYWRDETVFTPEQMQNASLIGLSVLRQGGDGNPHAMKVSGGPSDCDATRLLVPLPDPGAASTVDEPVARDVSDAEEADAMRRFKASNDIILDLSPPTSLEARANVVEAHPSDDGYVVQSAAEGPTLLLPVFAHPRQGAMIVRIDETLPRPSAVCLFWKTRSKPFYKLCRLRTAPAGHQIIFMTVPLKNMRGQLRFDPMSGPGECAIRSIQARVVEP